MSQASCKVDERRDNKGLGQLEHRVGLFASPAKDVCPLASELTDEVRKRDAMAAL